jgi:hypothetical protein
VASPVFEFVTTHREFPSPASRFQPMHHPHDKLFKAGFSDPETSAGFLRSQLPPLVVDAIDWSSLCLQPGSFID